MLDKLLQYRLVDSADLIAYAFAHREGKTWSDLDLWATLKSTVSTIEGRCAAAKKRAEGLQMAKDERRERELVGGQGESLRAAVVVERVLIRTPGHRHHPDRRR